MTTMKTHHRFNRGWILPVVAVVVILTTLAGQAFPANPNMSEFMPYQSPGSGLLLGADNLGRNVFASVLHGGAGLIVIAMTSTIIAECIGISLGLILASEHPLARACARLLDIILVIPSLLVVLVLLFSLGRGMGTMTLIVTIAFVPFTTRFTRALALPVLTADFVNASRLAGDSRFTVMFREILPNIAPPLLADAGTRFVSAFYIVAAIGFLGFSPLGDTRDWASMIQENLAGLDLNPWACLVPALCIVIVCLPINLLADRAGGDRT